VNKELKDAWVEALRSGKYPQGEGVLKSAEGEYCCLGVLGEVLVKAGEAEFMNTVTGACSVLTGGSGTGRSRTKLPVALRNKIGLPISAQEELIDMNDNLRKNFIEISNWIEENV